MIEIIYKGEDKGVNDEVEIKLPKNIRQIGVCEQSKRIIYVEDFVVTYVNHFNSRNLKYGVLLGKIERGNGHTYIFISGAVTANAVLDNELVFDEDVWTSIYEEIKLYFEDVEIVGWFASMPSLLNNDILGIERLHIDHFAGDDRVCLLIDREEGDENFYLYEQDGMKKSDGFYIYYEKNMDMQSYMSMHVDKRSIPEDYEQSHKRGLNVKVHDLLFDSPKEEEQDKKYVETGWSRVAKQLPSFAYSASSFMLIAVLAGTVAMMNASGQLKELKTVVNGLVGKEQTTSDIVVNGQEDTVKVIEVEGQVSKEEATEPSKETEGSAATEGTKESETVSIAETEKLTQSEDVTASVTESSTELESTTMEKVTEPQEEETTELPTEPPTLSTVEPVTEASTEAVNTGVYYKIEKGDSLYTISLKKYGTINMVGAIAKANNLKNENLIQEGETIVLP